MLYKIIKNTNLSNQTHKLSFSLKDKHTKKEIIRVKEKTMYSEGLGSSTGLS